MNVEFLRAKIGEKFESIEKFADAIEVSRITVQNWLNQKHTPENNRLFVIADTLELAAEEIDTLMGAPKLSVVFRKIGGSASDDVVREKSQQLADTFFKIDGSAYSLRGNLYPITGASNPIDVANHIRKFLGLEKNEPVTLNEVLVELKRNNIAVFFIPFRKLNLSISENTSSHREVAFTAFKGDRKIIFLDTERTRDGANFDICHELAHIVLDHRITTDDEEKLCNSIAQELVYPAAFFADKRADIEPFISRAAAWNTVVTRFNHFFTEYDWSPKGLALALAANELIARKSHPFIRLMRLDSLGRSKQVSIDKQYFSTLDTSDFENLSAFFAETIFSNKDVYKPFLEMKEAALEGRLSPRRFATIMNIDSGDAEELIRSWEEEVGTEDGQDDQHAEHDSAKSDNYL
ncbi:MAG: ImmA/IrrE family metallo-endopeptidase [Bdellovibrionales bacterium]|nr:ImmA/IrrE family metallo-endopeptidase [Bdellovibrionales bacterium]